MIWGQITKRVNYMSPLSMSFKKLNYDQHPFHCSPRPSSQQKLLTSSVWRKEVGHSQCLGSEAVEKSSRGEDILWDTAPRRPAWQRKKGRRENTKAGGLWIFPLSTQGRATARQSCPQTELWDQTSSDLEYPTDSSSPLKVYLLLAYWSMNVTAYIVRFGVHPRYSTAYDDKIRSAPISPSDTSMQWASIQAGPEFLSIKCFRWPPQSQGWWQHGILWAEYFLLSLPGLPGLQSLPCRVATQQAGPPGSAHPPALQPRLQLAAPAGSFRFHGDDGDNPSWPSSLYSTTMDPWTFCLPFLCSGSKSHSKFLLFKEIYFKKE